MGKQRFSRFLHFPSFSFWGLKQGMLYCFTTATGMLLIISLMMPVRPDAQIYFTSEFDYLLYMIVSFGMIAFYAVGCMFTGAYLESRKRAKEDR